MIRLLHTADLHLDAPFPGLGDREGQRREDFLRTFEGLLALAGDWQADLLIIAGDLFDTPSPSAATRAGVRNGLQRLAGQGTLPVLLPGTHDSPAFPNSVYGRPTFPGCLVLDQERIIDPVPVDIRGERVFLYGFVPRPGDPEPPLAGMKRRSAEGLHIGVLHGSRLGSREWDYRPKDLPFSLDDLRDWDLDYVALGHYHNFEVLEQGGRVLACYPGSPEGKRFGENGPRYAALVTLERGAVRVDKRAVNQRTLQEASLDLSGCADAAGIDREITALGGEDVLLRLELTGLTEVPIDPVSLAARTGAAFFHLEIRDHTRFFDSRFARRIANEPTVRGSFVRRVRARMEQADAEERPLLEKAFREVLTRFQRHGGEGT